MISKVFSVSVATFYRGRGRWIFRLLNCRLTSIWLIDYKFFFWISNTFFFWLLSVSWLWVSLVGINFKVVCCLKCYASNSIGCMSCIWIFKLNFHDSKLQTLQKTISKSISIPHFCINQLICWLTRYPIPKITDICII